MNKVIRISGIELMNYLFNGIFFISDEDLYKCVYRLTDRFRELDVAILTNEIDEWLLDSIECPSNEFNLASKLCNKLKTLLSAGDNGTYNPPYTILTEKDMNDLRVAYDVCRELIEGEYTFGEYGEGFNCVNFFGSNHNDEFINNNGKIKTKTNHSGGIQAGISNGEDIIFRTAFKPTPTIFKKQNTVDINDKNVEYIPSGRHDPCILPRAVPVVEAMVWLTIMDLYLINKRNY